MPNLDKRILLIKFYLGKEVKEFTELAMSAKIVRTSGKDANTADISVANLSQASRDYILSNAKNMYSPSGAKKQVPFIEVFAGYQSTGIDKIFGGDVVSATLTERPDITLNIKCSTLASEGLRAVSSFYDGQVDLKTICQGVAKDLGLTLIYEATAKNIKNYSYSGIARDQVTFLNTLANIKAYVDENLLVVQNKDDPLKNSVKLVNKETGMIGIPAFNEHGIVVKTLFDPGFKLGGLIDVKSDANPTVNGRFIARRLTYDLSNIDDSFYCTIESALLPKKKKDNSEKGEA
jgi:hypothetical protein